MLSRRGRNWEINLVWCEWHVLIDSKRATLVAEGNLRAIQLQNLVHVRINMCFTLCTHNDGTDSV